MQGARRGPWLIPRPSRATPQTPLPEPTLRERTDLPSFVVVASSLGLTQPRRLRLDDQQIRLARGHAEYSDRLLGRAGRFVRGRLARGAAFRLDLQLHFLVEAILVAVVHTEIGAI